MKYAYSILLFLAPLACLADKQKGFIIIAELMQYAGSRFHDRISS